MSTTTAKIAAVDIARTHVMAWKGLSGVDLGLVIQAAEMRAAVVPLFAAPNAPTEDGLVYRDQTGAAWVRGDWAVATRPGPFPGPDVAFVKHVDGTILIEIVLRAVGPAGAPADAGVLGHLASPPSIVWQTGAITLPMPTPFVDAATGEAGLRMLQALTAAQVADLFGAMTTASAGAMLRLDSAFDYQVTAQGGGRPTDFFIPDLRIRERPTSPRDLVRVPSHLTPGFVIPGIETGEVGTDGILLTPMRSETAFIGMLDAAPAALAASATGVMISSTLMNEIRALGPGFQVHDIIVTRDPPVSGREDRVARFTRRLPFFFDRTLDQNAAIYRAVSGATTLDQGWSDTAFGVLRPAEFANTLYLLPHEIRLAYDAARGLPHMMPVSYAAPDDSRRIRVILRAEPWYDLEQVSALQVALAAQTSGGYLAPDIIAGGVAAARLSLQTIFPESIQIDDAAVDLRCAFDLTLDFSEEYYSLFVTILTGPVGLTGAVVAVLTAATDSIAEETRIIPVTLAFGRLGRLPLMVDVAPAAINPDRAVVRNAAAHPVTITGVTASLLQIDSNAVLPAGVFAASVDLALPHRMDPGATVTVTLAPATLTPATLTPATLTSPPPVWNAVTLSPTRTSIDIDPLAALRAIHALAPTGSLGWSLTIESPQLAMDQTTLPGPERLFAIEVQLTLGAGPPMQATLRPGLGQAGFTIPRNLDDLMSVDTAVAFLTLTVRARGVYQDGFGDWSAPRENTGDTVFVFVTKRTQP